MPMNGELINISSCTISQLHKMSLGQHERTLWSNLDHKVQNWLKDGTIECSWVWYTMMDWFLCFSWNICGAFGLITTLVSIKFDHFLFREVKLIIALIWFMLMLLPRCVGLITISTIRDTTNDITTAALVMNSRWRTVLYAKLWLQLIKDGIILWYECSFWRVIIHSKL